MIEFPDFSACASSLQNLYLSNNNISKVNPTYLHALRYLVWLKMPSNKLSFIPNVPGPGMYLRNLNLDNNLFIECPALSHIGSRLEVLSLNGNTELMSLPAENLKGLFSLTEIHLAGTSLTSLPDFTYVANTLELITLSTSSNPTPVKELPADLAPIIASKTGLVCSNCNLKSLPALCSQPSASWDLRGNTLDICSCNYLLLKKMVSDGASILVDNKKCGGHFWSSLTYMEFEQICDSEVIGNFSCEYHKTISN